MLFGCGRLIVSEWSLAERHNMSNTSDFITPNDESLSNTNASDKKGLYSFFFCFVCFFTLML
jgi:hypothetical protein